MGRHDGRAVTFLIFAYAGKGENERRPGTVQPYVSGTFEVFRVDWWRELEVCRESS